jgi:hypothetical protein
MARARVGDKSGQMKIRAILVGASILAAMLLWAATPSAPLHLAATTANVKGAPDPVRIEILRWSTDEDRERLMSAWNLKPSATPNATKGAGKQGKGAPKGTEPAAAATPETALARALEEATTVGYLWSSESAGYALRYAGKLDNPDGSQRIILITDRRLGAFNQLWNPTSEGAANTYEFSVIELRLSAKGEGAGKASLVGKVVPDAAAKIVTPENYDALPIVFRNVHTQAGKQ